MKLKNKIDIQIKESMLNKNKSRLIALRAIKSAILLSEKSEEKADLDEIKLLMKLIKQRKDSLKLYLEQNRQDLADKEQIEIDILDGYIPTFVCASVGTTNTTAMDPILEIGEICKKYDIWLHVDAAMAGAAALCPEFRYLQDGLEYANSYTFNPHKWMLTNFDCSVLFIDDRKKITSAMSVVPEYLKNKGSETAFFCLQEGRGPMFLTFISSLCVVQILEIELYLGKSRS